MERFPPFNVIVLYLDALHGMLLATSIRFLHLCVVPVPFWLHLYCLFFVLCAFACLLVQGFE